MVNMTIASLNKFVEDQLRQAYDLNKVKQIQEHLNSFVASHLNEEKVNGIFLHSLNETIISFEVSFNKVISPFH